MLLSAGRLLDAPARTASRARNAAAEPDRAARWRPARDALWRVLDRRVPAGARVAVAGAGNADDLPLTRLLARAGAVDLIDLHPGACRRALAREPRELAARARAIGEDVTAGAADRALRAARAGRAPRALAAPDLPVAPLGDGAYDVVVADLLYTQLLYPALADAGLPAARVDAALAVAGQPLTDLAVARMHASAPDGVVVHVHDALGWWRGHQQPVRLDELLRLSPGRALRAAAGANAPRGADVRGALRRLGAPVRELALWRWPFAPGTDYLVAAIVAGPPVSRAAPAAR